MFVIFAFKVNDFPAFTRIAARIWTPTLQETALAPQAAEATRRAMAKRSVEEKDVRGRILANGCLCVCVCVKNEKIEVKFRYVRE